MKTINWNGREINSKQIIEEIKDGGVCLTLSEGVHIESKESLIDTLKHYGHDKDSLLKYNDFPYWVTTNRGNASGITDSGDLETLLKEIT